MAYSYTWPLSLPTTPLVDGYSESIGPRVMSTSMGQGPSKIRAMGTPTDPVTVQMCLTEAQVQTLDSFITTSLKGVKRFGLTHPRKETIMEFRFVPDSDGRLLRLSKFGLGLWLVSFTLEVMP